MQPGFTRYRQTLAASRTSTLTIALGGHMAQPSALAWLPGRQLRAAPVKLPAATDYQALELLRARYECHQRAARMLAHAGLAAPAADERALLELGRQVASILPNSICAALGSAVQQARQRRRTLQIILEVAPEASALHSIPWELLVLPGLGDFVLLDPGIGLARRLRGVGRAGGRLAWPLRLLACAANPPGTRPIELAASHTALGRALGQAQPAGWQVAAGTLQVLQARLVRQRPQVLHLLCHGEASDCGHGPPRYELLLAHADGYAQRVGGAELARVLALAPSLQLVVLQACHSGSIAPHAAASAGIAPALIQAGVPAVVAMQGEVAQPSANAFVAALYAELAHGAPLARAMTAGRVAMRLAGGADWSLPVLYVGGS